MQTNSTNQHETTQTLPKTQKKLQRLIDWLTDSGEVKTEDKDAGPCQALMNFKKRISWISATTTHAFTSVFLVVESLTNFPLWVALVWMALLVILLLSMVLSRKKLGIFQLNLSLIMTLRALVMTFLAQKLGIEEEFISPSLYLANLMTTILLVQAVPSPLTQGVGVLTEAWIVGFSALCFRDKWPLDANMFAFIVLLMFHFIHSNLLKKRVCQSLSQSFWVFSQILSLKNFMDKNLLASVVIFSKSESCPSRLKIEFSNSMTRKLTRVIRGLDTEDLGSLSSQAGIPGIKKQKPLMPEELGCFSLREDPGTTLGEKINRFREAMMLEHGKRKGSLSEKSLLSQHLPETFLCDLEKQSKLSALGVPFPELVKRQIKYTYKAVLSSIVFDNELCVILQLEDASSIVSLEEERKVSKARESVIQYFLICPPLYSFR